MSDERDEPVVAAIPEPHRARRSLGWIRYPVVLALFAATFLLNYWLCQVWRDASLFSTAAHENTPAILRAYLADRRNTRHRGEAQALLNALHEQAAKQIEAQNGQPELVKGLASLIRALRSSPAPVVTMSVVRDPKPEPDSLEGVVGPRVMPVLASTMIKQLATTLSPQEMNRMVGQQVGDRPLGEQMVAFGEAAEGFAMIQIEARLRRPSKVEAGGQGIHSVVWTVTFQADESAPRQTCGWKRDFRLADPKGLEREIQTAFNEFPKQLVRFLQNKVPPNEQP
jgi:hypothetical protein